MTHQERIEALQDCGYTEREAAFLVLAALHSGYFVRRQYNQFVNCGHGTTAIQLVRRTSANRHSRVAVFPRNSGVYHLCSRPLLQALGDPNNRNRRRRSLPAIKVKLMALDFVLAHPDLDYLVTEREKVKRNEERRPETVAVETEFRPFLLNHNYDYPNTLTQALKRQSSFEDQPAARFRSGFRSRFRFSLPSK